MSKAVYGVFNSSSEVLDAIRTLQARGYTSQDITVVADKEESWDLTDLYRKADVQTLADEDRDNSFLDKVKRFFTGEDHEGLRDRLYTLGLTDQDTDTYIADLKDGKFLILTEDAKGFLDNRSEVAANIGLAETAVTAEDTSRNTLTDDLFTPDPVLTDWSAPYPAEGSTLSAEELEADRERTLKLREERLQVDKEAVQAGEVVVHKNVVEENRTVNVPVEHEEVFVERRAVADGRTDAAPIGEDETIRIPVTEERVEVTKKPVVTEEIVIGKRTVQETEQVQDTVRKEKVDLDQSGNPVVRETESSSRR
ncbi:YsnF/AvaK domain-containing protein [Paenibacillus xanthanilyticus]|uniref:YsnF/AvaK domain-containing protein n=1 Tax=Paenibacillus xanthanilyticus TaxID=1783531 RepID=A0ABV8KBG2_9BACL